MADRIRVVPSHEMNVQPLLNRLVGVLGYGSQGEAHALNLRDSGCRVIVAQRAGGPRYAAAESAGFEVTSVADAVSRADLLIVGLPDDAAPAIFSAEIAPQLRTGQTLGFIHGFAVHYRQIMPPQNVDVVLVAPKAQGRAVRSEYVTGRGVLALVAVHQDATSRARETALAWAAGIGADRSGMIETTFADETETDLFGEQAVLCGGLTSLIKAGFETLVEAGYPPELAYFECCHEVKLIADLIYERGITAMRERVSSTARYGDLTRGPRVIDAHTRSEMRRILAEIRSGSFASELMQDTAAGRPRARQLAEQDGVHPLEAIGAKLRRLMWGQA